MPTLAEIVHAVWSTEIQPGLTAGEILAAWLRYMESGADAIVNRISGSAGGGRYGGMYYPDAPDTPRLSRSEIEADDFDVLEIALAFLRTIA